MVCVLGYICVIRLKLVGFICVTYWTVNEKWIGFGCRMRRDVCYWNVFGFTIGTGYVEIRRGWGWCGGVGGYMGWVEGGVVG